MLLRLLGKSLVLFIAAVFATAAFAQNANSSIQGTVEDSHGAVVPGATVDLTNVGTNQQLHATSNGNGFFIFSDLGPADYKVSVSMQGFAAWEGSLTLRVSQAAQVNPTLTAASVSTHVTVRNVTPTVDRVNPTISDVKTSAQIEAMPITGRTVLQVLAFSPGVVANGYGGSGGGFTRVNGIPGGSVNYVIDGQTAKNAFSGALQQNPQSTMTFQEVKIQTSNGDAQFGTPGTVEMVTKSGTNQFHGQIFELNQNQHLKARSFHSGPVIPFLQHNEYGFQVGGPVVPNHTFFFFDMEWLKTNEHTVEQYIVPTADQRGGNLSDLLDTNGNAVTVYDPNSTVYDPVTQTYDRTPFPGNVIPANRLNPVASKVMGVTPVAGLDAYPLPNISGQEYWKGNPNLQPPSLSTPTNVRQITAKVDQLFGASRLAARYYNETSDSIEYEYYAPTAPNEDFTRTHNGSLALTSVISPNAVNVAHVGVQYNNVFSGPVAIPGIADKLGLPNYPGMTSWMGFYWFYGNDSYWTALDRNNPKSSPTQIVSASDKFSWNKGNHQMMFGFQVNNTRLTTSEVGQPGGNYSFSSNFTALQDPTATVNGNRVYDVAANDTGSGLADFLLGEVSEDTLNIFPFYHTRQTEYDAFIQDDWRVTRNLTLNLGLRYEYWTPFSDASGLTSTFIPDVPGGMVAFAGKGPLPSQVDQNVLNAFVAAGLPIESAADAGLPLSLYSMPKNNWNPRIGFAYQLNSKTVLRGGWGSYQWILPLQQYQQATRKNPPFSYSVQLQPGTVGGVATNPSAAELEFPVASADFGGPQPINQWVMGNQNCANQPAGTCTAPGLLLNTSNVSVTQGSGFNIVSMNPDVKPQTVQEYNLTLGRELPWDTGLQVSYIGNHYTNQLQFDPINYLVPRDSCAAANSPDVAACEGGTEKFRRPYEVFRTSTINNYDRLNYNGYGNTNELQVQLTKNFGNNFVAQFYFTWLKALNTLGGTAGQSKLGISQNSAVPASLTPGYSLTDPTSTGASLADRTRVIYANDQTLPTKTVQFNFNYTLPFGRGQRFLGNAHGLLNALVSGYNIAPFFLWHSGLYFAPYATPLKGGLGPNGRLVSLAPGKTGILPKSQRTAAHWFDASIWDPLATTGPTSGAYNGQTYMYSVTSQEGDFRNNIPFNYMTGPGFNEMDLGLYKDTPLWRNLKLNFAAQIYNVYNHINLGMPNTKGIIRGGTGTPRNIQLQAKIVF